MSKHAPLGAQAQEVIDQLRQHASGAAKRENFAQQALAQAESTIQSFKDRLENAKAEIARLRGELELTIHKVIACGVAAHNSDASLASTPPYSTKWDSPQLDDVRKLRADRDRFRSALSATQATLRGATGTVAGEVVVARGRWDKNGYLYIAMGENADMLTTLPCDPKFDERSLGGFQGQQVEVLVRPVSLARGGEGETK